MEKNYDQARYLSSKFLKKSKDPQQRIEAKYYIGLSQLRLGQYSQSRKAFHTVMQATADVDLYDKAAMGLVESYYLTGFYKDALKQGEALLRKHPNSQSKSLIYLKIGRTYLKMMEWQKARNYLQKIINEFPESLEAPIAKGLLDEKEYFSVQVGSFLEQQRAIKLSEELKEKDQYAYIVETTSPDGKTFFRVRVGQATSLNDAHNLESKLTRLGYPTLIYP